MYAVEATVRILARNRISKLGTDEIQAIGVLADEEINAALGEIYYFPYDASGTLITNIPKIVKNIASYLVAALIELESYAQNADGNASQNPYGSKLDTIARKMLKNLCDGNMLVQDAGGLQRVAPLKEGQTLGTFEPVQGFHGPNRIGRDERHQQGVRRRRGW